jgi:hypothetical protein
MSPKIRSTRGKVNHPSRSVAEEGTPRKPWLSQTSDSCSFPPTPPCRTSASSLRHPVSFVGASQPSRQFDLLDAMLIGLHRGPPVRLLRLDGQPLRRLAPFQASNPCSPEEPFPSG